MRNVDSVFPSLPLKGYTTSQLSALVAKFGPAGTAEANAIRVWDLVRDTTTGQVKVFNGAAFVAGTDAAPPALPANTVLPAITGTATAGQTLTASTGTWTGAPAPTYAYQWKVDGVAVSGETASTFVAVSGTITVTVTATNYLGAVTATSAGTVVA
jgi:hypothetical protein